MEVFFITIEDVSKCDIERIRHIMPERFDRAQAYKQEKDRLLCLGGAVLLTEIVGITNGSDIRFNSFGKPYVPDLPEFSISHSGEVCVLATGDKPVGIDIERDDPNNLTIAKQVFSDKEYEWMSSDPAVRFHRLWTLKESLLKAVGTGLVDDMKSVDILPFTAGEPVTYGGKKWYAAEIIYPGYHISVCSAGPVTEPCLYDRYKVKRIF